MAFQRQPLSQKDGREEMEAGVVGMIGRQLRHAGIELAFSRRQANLGPLD